MNWFESITRWVARLIGWPMREPVGSEPEYVWRPAVAPAEAPVQTSAGPRFQATAGDQSTLSEMFAAIRARLRLAYTPAQPITDRKMYSGRSRVLGSVIQAIEDQRLHAVIYGERGLGKTSTLHVLAQTALDAQYRVIYLTCSADTNFDEVFRALAAEIPLMFHADYGPTSRQAERRETVASILPAEPVNTRLGGEILGKVVGTRILVILDEFDRATSDEFRRNIAELIKSLSDRAARVQLMIGGVAANLSELIANVPSIQRNIFALQLPKMTSQEIRELVKNGEGVSGVTFDESAIDTITAKALGFPYLATLLSHRSALVAIDRGRVVVDDQDVNAATAEVVEEFRGRVSRRSLAQIDTVARDGMLPGLGAIAGAAQTFGGWFVESDVGAQHGDSAARGQVGALLERLTRDRQLIESRPEDANVAYHFVEESVPAYLWLASGVAGATGPVSEVQTAGAPT
jgi:Cdc6-like AAA superfamily ATPase